MCCPSREFPFFPAFPSLRNLLRKEPEPLRAVLSFGIPKTILIVYLPFEKPTLFSAMQHFLLVFFVAPGRSSVLPLRRRLQNRVGKPPFFLPRRLNTMSAQPSFLLFPNQPPSFFPKRNSVVKTLLQISPMGDLFSDQPRGPPKSSAFSFARSS